MSNSTTFVDFSGNTPIKAAWLNDVNQTVFGALADSHGNPPKTAADVIANLGLGTGSGVASFNSRTGAVTLNSTDVIGALGYTPASSSGAVSSFNARTGAVALQTSDLTGTTSTTNLGAFTIDGTAPSQRIAFPTTNPNGWNTGRGRKTVDFTFTSNNFFTLNPNAHLAIVCRCTTSLISTAVRGQGVALGNATGYTNPSDLNPTPLLETWMNSAGGPADNYTWSNSESARSIGIQDGVTYRCIIDTTQTESGNRYLRYRLWKQVTTTTPWLPLVDTGDVLDYNIWADLTQQGLVFGYVLQSTLSGWSIAVSACTVTWSDSGPAVPDQTIKLSRYGAQMEGDIKFLGNSRRIQVITDATSNLSTWTSIQTQTTNLGTSLLVKPNGTSTTSNFLAVNSSNPVSGWQGVSFGMNGSAAQIETAGQGVANPVLNINVGVGGTVAQFVSYGLTLAAASATIGVANPTFANFSNWNGTNAHTFTDSTTFNVDSVCQIGTIAGFIGGSYNATALENIIRPLYCMLSVIYGDLKNKRLQ